MEFKYCSLPFYSVIPLNSAKTRKNEKFVGRYGSVAKAFKALNLPFEKHIPFRVRLKDARRLNKGARHNFEQYTFELIEKPK